MQSSHPQPVEILSVSALNFKAKNLLMKGLGRIRVSGEISGFMRASSGHCYFSLKDEKAQVKCAYFKMDSTRLRTPLKEGLAVVVEADVTLYEPRGDFQLVVRDIQLSGLGALQQAFEVLKANLQAEGLFDPSHKRALPTFPKTIGVITSAQGAALHDILRILRDRAPHVSVIIFPTLVQGSEAAPNIVKRIQQANTYPIDILIVGRGGGSIEDLWSFNEEIVARAIFHSQIPVISAVGHEVDFTIADFVADVRAPTPTAAAHLAVPEYAALIYELETLSARLMRHMNFKFTEQVQRLDYLQKRLQHPAEKLKRVEEKLHALAHRLTLAMQNKTQRMEQKLALLTNGLQTMSPLATLARGFSVLKTESGMILRDANAVKTGDHIQAILQKGELDFVVAKITTTKTLGTATSQ